MNYDEKGRLISVKTLDGNGVTTVSDNVNYEYNHPAGLVSKATLAPQATVPVAMENTYDVVGRLEALQYKQTSTGGLSLLKEEMVYDKQNFAAETDLNLTPSSLGNIAGIKYDLHTASGNRTETFKYTYDNLSRLIISTHTNRTNTTQSMPLTMYSYTVDGALAQSVKRLTASNQKYAEYSYAPNTHRLESVAGNLRDITEDASVNFSYDANGNMIEDKAKNLQIEYDWQNMPVRFIFKGADDKPRYVQQVLYGPSGTRVGVIEMARQ
jgi:hypothetical protein